MAAAVRSDRHAERPPAGLRDRRAGDLVAHFVGANQDDRTVLLNRVLGVVLRNVGEEESGVVGLHLRHAFLALLGLLPKQDSADGLHFLFLLHRALQAGADAEADAVPLFPFAPLGQVDPHGVAR